jgi:hypothetical protein
MAGASDILQQALENSGLTERAEGKSGSGGVATSRGLMGNMTFAVHDPVSGLSKRHLIRKVHRHCEHLCVWI